MEKQSYYLVEIKMELIKQETVIPKEIIETFESLEYEEEGFLKFHHLELNSNDLNYFFELHSGIQNQYELWKISARKPRDWNIDSQFRYSYFNIYSEHCLLWRYNDSHIEVHTKSKSKDPNGLFCDLYSLHMNLDDGSLPVDSFINGNPITRCNSDFGVFAKGPKNLMTKYMELLNKYGRGAYLFGERDSLKWNGKNWIKEDGDYILMTIGEAYIIAKEFKFEKIKPV